MESVDPWDGASPSNKRDSRARERERQSHHSIEFNSAAVAGRVWHSLISAPARAMHRYGLQRGHPPSQTPYSGPPPTPPGPPPRGYEARHTQLHSSRPAPNAPTPSRAVRRCCSSRAGAGQPLGNFSMSALRPPAQGEGVWRRGSRWGWQGREEERN